MTEDVPWIIKVELITEPSINIVIDVGVARTSVITVSTAEPCWMDRIVDFLAEYRIPDDEKEASKVRRLSFKKKNLFYLNLISQRCPRRRLPSKMSRFFLARRR